MKNRDFIIISLNPWYAPLNSTSKNVAKEISKQNRVLYINPPFDRRTILTRKSDPILQEHFQIIKKKGEDIVELGPNLWNYYPHKTLESANWVPSTKIFSWINYINNKRVAEGIKYAIKKLKFSNYIIINDKDLFRGFYLKELLNPEIYLYYDRDYILGVDYWRKHGLTLEPKLAKKSDLIVTHSDYLMKLLKPSNSNIFNVGSGIDLKLFNPDKIYEVPSELKGLNGPIIGYVGAITSLRMDMEAIIQIAKERPNWNIVFVGPEDEIFEKSILHKMPNVLFCGRKSLEDLPSYIINMDICINPQIINELTIGNYPLKADEYLAMGKPVVATRTYGMKMFEKYTYLVDPGGDFVPAIELALKESSDKGLRKLRLNFAKSHSWEKIINNVYKAIEETVITKYSKGSTLN